MARHRDDVSTAAMLRVSAREALPDPRRATAAAVIVAAPLTGGLVALSATEAYAQAPVTVTEVANPASPSNTTVRVERGDTVSALAREAGVSTSAMLDVNGLGAFSIIRPGDELRLPDGPRVRTSAPPATVETAPAAPDTREAPAPAPAASSSRILDLARAQLGVMYAYGEESPSRGFDCSGLVQYVYGQTGVKLPRTSTAMKSVGTAVSREDARPGDLVIFNGMKHVAIYAGNNRMVEAARTGTPVREREIWTPNVSFRRV